jgi:hypothetical protein
MRQAFGAFAEAPSAESKQAVLEAAKTVDSITRIDFLRDGRTESDPRRFSSNSSQLRNQTNSRQPGSRRQVAPELR